MKFFKKFIYFLKVVPKLTKYQAELYLPRSVTFVFFGYLEFISRLFGRHAHMLVPKILCSVSANYFLSSNEFSSAYQFAKKSQRVEKSRKLAIHYEIEIIRRNSEIDLKFYLNQAISPEGIRSNKFDSAIQWAFWNLNHVDYSHLLERAINSLSTYEAETEQDFGPRELPEFTSNMGHLGYLTTYIGFYSRFDPSREIKIWPELTPNRFFLKLLVQQSPIRIHCLSGEPSPTDKHNILKRDSLAISRLTGKSYRIEYCSGTMSGQDFPELEVSKRFKLSLERDLSEQACISLTNLGFKFDSWFVILHIREPQGVEFSFQIRDSFINNYQEFCRAIVDLGGQVVRMGHNGFPILPKDFPAIDYAHSKSKSEEIDCWLWANCRWWTGNASGAAEAALAFGARRLIVDQWYWQCLGPSTDFFMPRLFVKDGEPQSIMSTLRHPKSRGMNSKEFQDLHLDVPNINSQLLVQAGVQMYQETSSKSVRPFQNRKTEESNFASVLSKALQNHNIGQRMQIPTAYDKFLLENVPIG